MRYADNVYLVQIYLERPLEDCPDAVATIRRSLLHDVMDARDNAHTLTYVVTERKSATGVLERYRAIANHPDIRGVRVFGTTPNGAASLGFIDPVSAKLDVAWRKLRERAKTENLQRANRVPIKRRRRARGKPIVGRGRSRKSTRQSD